MTNMARVKVRWHGFTGSPGYSNFFFREWNDGQWNPTVAEAAGVTGKVWNYFDKIRLAFPPVVNLTVESDVEVIDDATGQMTNVLNAGSRPTIVGTSGAANYAAAAGVVTNWTTAGVKRGRRVRGRTFLVPVSSGVFENNGTVAAGWMTTFSDAAAYLVAPAADSADFGVWSRPSAVGANDGTWHAATGSRVPDLAAVLRSRRD